MFRDLIEGRVYQAGLEQFAGNLHSPMPVEIDTERCAEIHPDGAIKFQTRGAGGPGATRLLGGGARRHARPHQRHAAAVRAPVEGARRRRRPLLHRAPTRHVLLLRALGGAGEGAAPTRLHLHRGIGQHCIVIKLRALIVSVPKNMPKQLRKIIDMNS